jgi:hypothetical protein
MIARKLGLLLLAVVVPVIGALGVAAPAHAASSAPAHGQTTAMTAAAPAGQIKPDATISGDCGKVTFVNYGNGNFYVIVDSFAGAIWWVDWQVNSFTGGNSGTWGGNGTSHLEFSGHAGSGGPMVLTGDAFTSGVGYCYFIPNPA